jgi:hypothetical protein
MDAKTGELTVVVDQKVRLADSIYLINITRKSMYDSMGHSTEFGDPALRNGKFCSLYGATDASGKLDEPCPVTSSKADEAFVTVSSRKEASYTRLSIQPMV